MFRFDFNDDDDDDDDDNDNNNRRWFVSESKEDNTTLLNLMKHLDPNNRGVIDYVGWSNRMRLDNLAEIAA